MIKVLIVEDSPVVQDFLEHVLSSDPAIRVVGKVSDGADALQAVRDKRPDVITMDIHMPKMDGFEATRVIMSNEPRPIVVVSASTGSKDIASTFQAIEAGALAVVLRPPGYGHPDHEAAVRELVRTVKMMSEIRVVRRFERPMKPKSASVTTVPMPALTANIKLVAIGASTGGPPVLNTILSGLGRDLPVPLIIVQHIAPGFTEAFAAWLSGASGFPVHIASHGQKPLAGHGYLSQDGFHIGVGAGLNIVLSNHAPEGGLRPSVAYLFHTAAEVLGPSCVGVLLTGMGRDGADQLKEMRDKGAITIAQDNASSIVHGMPGEAIKLGAAMHVLPPEVIAAMLAELARRNQMQAP